MVDYVGMSPHDVYRMKCEEYGCKMNSLLTKQLPKVPDNFDETKQLDLSNNFVGPKGLLPVLEVIKVCVGLKHLSLKDNQLSNQCVMNLADVVQTHKGISSIDLSNNPITIGAGKAILELIKVNTQIEKICLENTSVKGMLLRAIDVQLNSNRTDASSAIDITTDVPIMATEVSSNIAATTARMMLSTLPCTIHDFLYDENPIEQLTALCKKHSAQYSDPQFTPEWKSIRRVTLKDYPVASWERCINLPRARLFPDQIDLDIISPGATSCTWMLESLNALIRSGGRIESLVTPKQLSHGGVYTVKLFIDGKWRWIVIDDWIPLDSERMPVFCSTGGDPSAGVWISLIEKAIAKLHGSYQAIDMSVGSTHPMEKPPSAASCTVDFTGGIGLSRNLHQEEFCSEEWWNEFLNITARGAHIIATTSGDDSSRFIEVGLCANHSYSVQSIRSINGFRLLNLRSPYQKITWVGEWNDTSPLWEQHPDVKDALEVRNKTDSSFWMSYSSFLKYFDTAHIIKQFPSWNSSLVSGEWNASSAGGPYFEQSWTNNPRYKLTLQKDGQIFINLSLPDTRLAHSNVETLAFHLLRADYFPVRYDKDNVVIKTPYLITNSVSFEGELQQGTYWLVPSVYVPNVCGSFVIRLLSDSPFVIEKESLDRYWCNQSIRSMWKSSGEYQCGEDHPQFELQLPLSPEPIRILITVNVDKHESHCVVLFVCRSQVPGKRVLGAIRDDCVLVKSKYLIGNSVQLECQIPGGDLPYVIVPCLQPEGSRSQCSVDVLTSVPSVSLSELPMWSKKSCGSLWSHSSTYQDSTGNPQFELVCPIAGQHFVIKLEVSGHDDPSILFFVVDNNGNQGQGLSGLIPETKIICTSTYMRATSVAKDFCLPSPCSDSYIIIPTLQPAGSAAKCKITVSCPGDDYQLHSLLE